jgi:hypothetical protein
MEQNYLGSGGAEQADPHGGWVSSSDVQIFFVYLSSLIDIYYSDQADQRGPDRRQRSWNSSTPIFLAEEIVV